MKDFFLKEQISLKYKRSNCTEIEFNTHKNSQWTSTPHQTSEIKQYRVRAAHCSNIPCTYLPSKLYMPLPHTEIQTAMCTTNSYQLTHFSTQYLATVQPARQAERP